MEPIYKITVEVTRLEQVIGGGEWVNLGVGVKGANEEGKGRAPQVIQTEKKTREVYSQTVSELDLKAVIGAVNRPTFEMPETLYRDAGELTTDD